MSESIEALRRANPRADASFDESVEAVARAVSARLVTATRPVRPSRTRLLRPFAAAAVAVAVAAAVYVTVGSIGPRSGVEDAAAAVKKAATVSAASAQRSGTAVVRLTHGGTVWAGSTMRWHGDDLSVSSDAPTRLGRAGSRLLVVGGTLYGIEAEHGGWVAMGSPSNIDPGSGTTPAEYLAAVREDVGGATLKRITGAMTEPTTRDLSDGSTVYSGAVRAGLIAMQTGFKQGLKIRVLPFGFVAHGEAANPASPLRTALTVGADGIVRELAVTWSDWSYTVTYHKLGSTPAIAAPANAPSLEQLRRERAARG
jgi:hypothetical protein